MFDSNDRMLSTIIESIQKLFKEAETNNLSEVEFAAQIWKGAINSVIPETTLASILFEKAAKVSPEETYQMIYKLKSQSLLGKEEAIREAFTLIIKGLEVINEESIMRQICDKN